MLSEQYPSGRGSTRGWRRIGRPPSVSTGPTSPRVPLGTGSPIAGSKVRDAFGSVDPVPVS